MTSRAEPVALSSDPLAQFSIARLPKDMGYGASRYVAVSQAMTSDQVRRLLNELRHYGFTITTKKREDEDGPELRVRPARGRSGAS